MLTPRSPPAAYPGPVVGRMRRGACIGCGYDLGYDFVRGCPECGWRRDAENVARQAAERDAEAVGAGRG